MDSWAMAQATASRRWRASVARFASSEINLLRDSVVARCALTASVGHGYAAKSVLLSAVRELQRLLTRWPL